VGGASTEELLGPIEEGLAASESSRTFPLAYLRNESDPLRQLVRRRC
jgi:hypothetical protein